MHVPHEMTCSGKQIMKCSAGSISRSGPNDICGSIDQIVYIGFGFILRIKSHVAVRPGPFVIGFLHQFPDGGPF